MSTPRRAKDAARVGDLLRQALRDLGMPSGRLAPRVAKAWEQAADPAWKGLAVPRVLVGGVLVVGVSSAALREELAQFHRARLLDVLRAALPDVVLAGLRFSADVPPLSGETP